MRVVLCALMVLASLGVSTGVAFAQTTGSLQGTVLDEDELEIPGVAVTIRSPNLIGGEQTTETGGNGYYRFTELLPGVYEITAVKGGFQTVTISGVQVVINRSKTQNIAMKLGEAVEEIDVVGTTPVDTESTAVGQVLDKEMLQNIPAGRTYQSAVQMAAGVTGGSNPNMGGGASNENTYMLDGATITDPVTGTFALNFNYDAIQQVEVLLGGYEAEYGISLGGIVNLVTDSGTNNLQYLTSVYYTNGDLRPRTDARFTADGFELGPSGFDNTFNTVQVSALVSGPLVRDKAWFVLSYQHDRSLIAATGIPQRRDFDGHYMLAKLTVQPTSEHRFTALLQADPTTIDNVSQGNPFQKDESQGRQAQSGFVSQLRWQWFISPDIVLDSRVQVQKSSLESMSVPCTHNRNRDIHPCRPVEAEGDVDFTTPGRLGSNGAFDSVAWGLASFDDRFRYQASSKLSLLSVEDPAGGMHDFKFGIEFTQLVNNYKIGFGGNTRYVDLNIAGFDPDTFRNYYWIETSGAFQQRNLGMSWSMFAQDAYKPVSNLTIKYGLRMDNTVMRNDVGEAVLTGNLFGPRLHAAWDPWNDQKTRVAVGYGKYNETGRQSLTSFTSQGAFGSKLYLGEVFGDGDRNNRGFFNTQAFLEQFGTRENPNEAIDTIRLPSVDEFILLFQRQVATALSVGVNSTARFTRNLYEPDELSIIYDEDGSSIIGSRRADPSINVLRLRTPHEARRNYYRVDTFIEKVDSRRWGGRINYSYTFINGNSNSSLSGSFVNDPQTRYNYGRLLTDLSHSIKAFGYWNVPLDPWAPTLGMTFEYLSGLPFDRFYWGDQSLGGGGYGLRIRDRGTYFRSPGVYELSLKYRQAIDVRRGQLQLDFEVRNVLNSRASQSLNSLLYQQNRMFIFARQSPLRLQLGLRYKF